MDLRKPCSKMLRGFVEFLSNTEAETCFQADSLLLFVLGDPREYHATYFPSSAPPKKKRKMHFTRCVWNNRIT
jgi:hypothetical protein